MTDVTVRKVPDDMLRTLKIRAAEAGKSLQAYLLDIIVREATTPTNAELAQRMKRSASLDLTDADIPGLMDAERDRR
ncbi:antitoxin [Streptomyces sp. 8K308]|uniref:FitA-like ribbon-helix-helix domain-containing protein n=1 Tax=Streptomyces sp. 8K308 TaxID=2530388 RepID=UPI001050AFF5|nr:antitoxin [Streptomyces sp. 8K308]TDC22769.1 antitoxin [Streptomyces sp. 8K308]